MADVKREVPYPVREIPEWDSYGNGRIVVYEDRSLLGSLIDGLGRKLQTLERETRHQSPHLSDEEKTEECEQHFDRHIKAWGRPAMALATHIDGEPGSHLFPVSRADDEDHER